MTFMMTFVVMKDIPPFLNEKVFAGKLKISTRIIIQTLIHPWTSSSPHPVLVLSALTASCFCYNPEIWREGWAVGGDQIETTSEASLTLLMTFLPAAMSSSSFGRSIGILSLCASWFWVSCLSNIYKIFDLLFQLILFLPPPSVLPIILLGLGRINSPSTPTDTKLTATNSPVFSQVFAWSKNNINSWILLWLDH